MYYSLRARSYSQQKTEVFVRPIHTLTNYPLKHNLLNQLGPSSAHRELRLSATGTPDSLLLLGLCGWCYGEVIAPLERLELLGAHQLRLLTTWSVR